MKAKSFFALAAAAFTMAACTPKNNEPVFEPEFTVTGASIKEGKIAVAAEGAEVKVTLSSNISWEATCAAEWISITPASAEVEKGTSKKFNVVVKAEANQSKDSRNTTIDFNVPGYEPLTVSVKVEQAGLVPVFNVYTSTMEPVPATVEVAADVAEYSVLVQANMAWAATSSASWADVSELQNPTAEAFKSGAIKFSANTESTPREAVITITPDAASGVQPYAFTLKQGAAVPFSVDVALVSVKEYAGGDVPGYPDTSCRISIMENPTKTVTDGYYGVWQSAAWEQSELDDPMEILVEYGNKMEAKELDGLNGVEGADPCEWIWSSLNPGTEYVFVAGFVAEDGSVYTAYSKSTTDKDEQDGGDKAPADLLGNWICPTATDRWGEDTYTNWTMTLKEVTNGVEIAGFDAGMEAIAAANSLTLSKPVAKWSDADKTLTIADSTPTGLAASGNSVVWRGHAGGYYTSTVYTYDATAHTLSLSVDGFMAVAGTSAYSGFDAPLVFYKEGHVPSSVKACGSVNKSVARAAVKDIKAAKAGHVSAKAVLR